MIGELVGLRRAGVLLLWTVAVAFVFASAGSSSIAGPPPAADLNPILYPGTLRPDARCNNNPGGCRLAEITFTNPQKFAANSRRIETKNTPFNTAKHNGTPPAPRPDGTVGPTYT